MIPPFVSPLVGPVDGVAHEEMEDPDPEVDPVDPNARITEDGETRITEDGETRIIE